MGLGLTVSLVNGNAVQEASLVQGINAEHLPSLQSHVWETVMKIMHWHDGYDLCAVDDGPDWGSQ